MGPVIIERNKILLSATFYVFVCDVCSFVIE